MSAAAGALTIQLAVTARAARSSLFPLFLETTKINRHHTPPKRIESAAVWDFTARELTNSLLLGFKS
ncbi:TPA: hypothetical protein DEX28_00575 [Patescibacteria group bacterium]|nr:hypothetical protein [Patescibacteria group bacterium]